MNRNLREVENSNFERKITKPVSVLVGQPYRRTKQVFINQLKKDPALKEFRFLDLNAPGKERCEAAVRTEINHSVGLIDLSNAPISLHKIKCLTEIIQKSSSTFLILVDTSITKSALQLLSQHATVLPSDICSELLASHLNLLRRNNDVSREAQFRKNITSEKPRDFTFNTPKHNLKILLAGAPSQHILAMVNNLSIYGYNALCTYRPGQSIRALETEDIDALVIFPENASDPLLSLARSMRRHTQYQSIPVITISDADTLKAMEKAPSIALHNEHIDLFGAPVVTGQIKHTKTIALTRKYLRHGGSELSRYKKAQLFKSNIFAARLYEEEKTKAQSPSQWYIALRLTAMDNANISTQEIINQTGPLINHIIRAEDFQCLLSSKGNSINCAIIVKENNSKNIQRVNDRIKGIIRNTVFHDPLGNPVSFEIATTYIPHEPDIRPEEIVARLLGGLGPN